MNTSDDAGRWINRGDTLIYESPWVSIATADVLLPDGGQVDHHVVRMPSPAAGTVVVRDGAVLLLYRHRFITDTWGWEIPAGGVDRGETPIAAGERETIEETGWQPTRLRPLCRFNPANGILDQVFHIFIADDAEHVGDPVDTNEATRIEWVPIERVREIVLGGDMPDGLSFGALTFAFTAGAL